MVPGCTSTASARPSSATSASSNTTSRTNNEGPETSPALRASTGASIKTTPHLATHIAFNFGSQKLLHLGVQPRRNGSLTLVRREAHWLPDPHLERSGAKPSTLACL